MVPEVGAVTMDRGACPECRTHLETSSSPHVRHLETFAQLDLHIFKVSTVPFKMRVLFDAVFLCCYYMLGGSGEVQITCLFGS